MQQNGEVFQDFEQICKELQKEKEKSAEFEEKLLQMELETTSKLTTLAKENIMLKKAV